MERRNGFLQAKVSDKGAFYLPIWLPVNAEHLRKTGPRSEEGGVKIGKRNITNLRYADDTILLAESYSNWKWVLMKV